MQHAPSSSSLAPLAAKGPIRIGARGSKLSMVQARWVQSEITRLLGLDPSEAETAAPITAITTTGDRVQDRRLLEIGGKALFTKEIEEALLDGRVDLAVHCVKDMATLTPPGLVVAANPEREDVRDAVISPFSGRIEDLPFGARLGTASLRRQAQALALRPDLQLHMLRGNVDTRLGKLEAGEADAILLAAAGLRRLGLADRISGLIDPEVCPPAPGQGALALQTRAADQDHAVFQALNHAPSAITVAAERGALEALEGSCKTAIGAYARIEGDRLRLIVEGLKADGTERWRREGEAALCADPQKAAAEVFRLGFELGEAVRKDGGEALIAVL
jgi:hydroxymethylbilane synthase